MSDPIPGKSYHVWRAGQYYGIGECIGKSVTFEGLWQFDMHRGSFYGDRWQAAEQKADTHDG